MLSAQIIAVRRSCNNWQASQSPKVPRQVEKLLSVLSPAMWCFVCRSGRLAGEEAGPELQVWGLAGRSGGQPGQRHAVEPAVWGQHIQHTHIQTISTQAVMFLYSYHVRNVFLMRISDLEQLRVAWSYCTHCHFSVCQESVLLSLLPAAAYTVKSSQDLSCCLRHVEALPSGWSTRIKGLQLL